MEFKIASVWNRRLGKGASKGHVIADSEDKEWIIKPYAGQVKVCSEYIAAQIALSMQLDVPEHTSIFLTEDLIKENKELEEDGFLPGYVLAIAYEDGYDLQAMEDSVSLMSQVLSGLDHTIAREQAIRMVVVDTAVANFDRHPGTLARNHKFSGHKGNLYFSKSGKGTYQMRAIDFGESFDSGNWGESAPAVWPLDMYGAMRFFFRQGWLTSAYTSLPLVYSISIQELTALNIDALITKSIEEMPLEWKVSNPSAPPGIPNGNITTGDFNSLSVLLSQRAPGVNAIIADKYPVVVKAFSLTTAI